MLHPWIWRCHADLKPVSVNQAYYKNRARSRLYMDYIDGWQTYLCGHVIPEDIDKKDMRFKVTIHVGFGNRASDLDNIVKPTVDIMAQWFGFDDKQVIHLEAFKHVVPRGSDYIYVKLREVFDEDYPAYVKEDEHEEN